MFGTTKVVLFRFGLIWIR